MTRVAGIQTVEAHAEKAILTSAIVSTEFLRNTIDALEPKFFKSKYAQTVMGWVLDYFKDYGEAPGQEIERIFEFECRSGSVPEQTVIEAMLRGLDDAYSGQINVNYATRNALDYIKRRDLYIRAQNTLRLLDGNNLSDAESEFRGFKEISQATSGWYNPFDPKCFSEVISEDNNTIFQFPGALGKLVGPVKRGWFGLFLGPVKRGKTFNLAEWALHLMMNRLKVVFISLEMSRRDMNERIYKRIVSAGSQTRRYDFPCWDCAKNQDGSCEETGRENDFVLFDDESDRSLPIYTPEDPYRPCTFCLTNHQDRSIRNPFVPTTWWESHHKEELGANHWEHVRDVGNMYKSYLRCISYPKFSKTFAQIARDIALLEMNEGFVPDAVVIDYEGIIKPEGNLSGRDGINDTAMKMAGFAAEKEVFLLSASQTNRGGAKDEKGKAKESVEATDIGEDWRKNAHVDFVLTINQLPKERRRGVCRLGAVAHRHKDIDEDVQCLVLQQLQLGQVHLDSMLVRMNQGHYNFVDYR